VHFSTGDLNMTSSNAAGLLRWRIKMTKKSKTTKTKTKKEPGGNGSQPGGNGTQPPGGNGAQPPDLINYDAAVTEGKTLVAAINSNGMRLGELADRLEPKYGDKTLERYAKDIGVNVATLSRWRSVYRRFKGIEAPEPQSPTVLKIIQGHPEAEEIAKGPKLTARQAHTLMRDYRKAHPEKQQEWQVRDTRGWVGQAVKHANEAIQYGHPAAHRLDPAILRPALDNPEQAEAALRLGGGALITLADEIKRALAPPTPPPMFDDVPAAPTPPTDDDASAAPDEAAPVREEAEA
jgi:transposase-like protein